MNLEQRNQELDEKIKLTDIPQAVEALLRSDKRRRIQLVVLTVSLLLDLALTVGLSIISVRTHELAAAADNNHQAIVRNCETSNAARANNKQLWDYLFNLPPDQPPTPEQTAQLNKFKAFVAKTFAPRDCNTIK